MQRLSLPAVDKDRLSKDLLTLPHWKTTDFKQLQPRAVRLLKVFLAVPNGFSCAFALFVRTKKRCCQAVAPARNNPARHSPAALASRHKQA
jgi:hypothetical protein